MRDDVIEQSGAVAEQGRSQSGGVILGSDAPFPPGNDRPGVHPLVQEHHADAGDRIAGQQRAGDGRRPPVPRQQGRMQVEAAQPGPGQNGRRQQPSVGGHDNEVGRKGGQFRHGVRAAEAWRLPYGNAQSQGAPLDGRRFQGLPPAPPPVGRRNGGDQRDAGVGRQRVQRGDDKRRRAEKYGAPGRKIGCDRG